MDNIPQSPHEFNQEARALCECGCGLPAPIYRGQPRRFIHGHNMHKVSTAERFWSKVDKVSSPNGCWLWCGASSDGYGEFYFKGKPINAHRMAYILTNGPVADNVFICHNCPGGDNRLCVNPAHLFPGTAQDNIQDMHYKGRARGGSLPGIMHPNARLTEDIVRTIRELRRDGMTYARLAANYGISETWATQICERKAWKHVA